MQTVGFSLDQFAGLKDGQTALDKMNETDKDLEALKNQLALAPDGISPQMPAELAGKTIQQLKALGATEMAQVTSRSGTRGHGFETKMSPEADEEHRKIMKSLEDDDMDPDFFQDNLGIEGDRFAMIDGSLKQQNAIQKHDLMMKKQKKLDDVAVAIVMQALEQGVKLEGDRVYEEMLEMYPHYQYKLEKREQQIKKAKDKVKGIVPKEKKRSPRNLGKTERAAVVIETEVVKDEDNIELQVEKYAKILEEYERAE